MRYAAAARRPFWTPLDAAIMAKSRSASKRFPTLPPITGMRLGGIAAQIRYHGRKDLMLAVFDRPTPVAGVFTRSTAASAAVRWDRSILSGARARALVVNSGNANAWTGGAGSETVEQIVQAVAAIVSCPIRHVFVSSTGVIGEVLDSSKIKNALPRLHRQLTPKNWTAAARAIMTTDTFPKGATRSATINGRAVTINGIAKGSGMIAPNMATMLAYVFTDARLPARLLQRMLRAANRGSFNAITVDGDTSTSDTVLAFATGAVALGFNPTSLRDPRLAEFRAALGSLTVDLAQQIVRDGEGASKFVTISVKGATSSFSARGIAFSIANSPLVKTAIAGSDPNWGRIIMAIGKASQAINSEKLSVRIGPYLTTEGGGVKAGYDESRVAEYMKGDEIDIDVHVGVGRGRATVWTCDLTHQYVTINADYRS